MWFIALIENLSAMSEILVNKIEQSGLITIDLQKFAPAVSFIEFDLKSFLFMELILKEKDFRQALSALDISAFEGKTVLLYCSADVIIPTWAYMLVCAKLNGIASKVLAMSPADYQSLQWTDAVDHIDLKQFEGKKVILKGCSDIEIPAVAYAKLSWRLIPIVQSLMYGEPCSTVPVYKKR